MIARLFRFVRSIDVLHCRVPTPAAVFASAIARLLGRPSFVLIVGDLQALLPTMPYRGIKRRVVARLYRLRGAERAADGRAVAGVRQRRGAGREALPPGARGHRDADDDDQRRRHRDSDRHLRRRRVRLLTVSRIDPRKDLRVLPEVRLRAAASVAASTRSSTSSVRPSARPARHERGAIDDAARAHGVGGRVRCSDRYRSIGCCRGTASTTSSSCRRCPGEGIPRVLLEAMAAGPAGRDDEVSPASRAWSRTRSTACWSSRPLPTRRRARSRRLVADAALRRRLIANGYDTARAYTLEAQAARMMQSVSARLRLALTRPVERRSRAGYDAGATKICFVLPSLNGGGAERAAVHILNALDAARVGSVDVSLPSRRAVSRRVSTARLRCRRGDTARASAAGCALRRFLRASRPDVVVSFLSYFSVLTATRAARHRRARRLQPADADDRVPRTTPTTTGARPWRRRLFSAGDARRLRAGRPRSSRRRTAWPTTWFRSFGVAAARIQRDAQPGGSRRRSRGCAPSRSTPAHERDWTRPVIVAAGRLADAKNYPLLIDAMAVLRERVPARLFILGQGDSRRELRARIVERHGLEDAVVLCGFQENPWKYIARADVVRADVALRRIRQRARRGDGLRRAGGGDRLAGDARNRAATASTACSSTGTSRRRWPRRSERLLADDALHAVCPPAHGRAPSDFAAGGCRRARSRVRGGSRVSVARGPGCRSQRCRWRWPPASLVGVVYALSPLTVWFTLAMVAARALGVERADWHRTAVGLGLLLVAIALRVLAVAGLFASTDHSRCRSACSSATRSTTSAGRSGCVISGWACRCTPPI